MKYVIETDHLTKTYGTRQVVSGVDLKVPEGSIYGFLGPNGAGKSTTLKMFLDLVKPSAGEITILGRPMNAHYRVHILKHTGSLIESPSYYGHLTGWENLKIVCMLKGADQSQINECLAIVRMENQKNKKASQYSLGMKQRLGLAAALIGNPRLLLLDEPTNGLDPAGIQEMRELICSLPEKYGMTVMVSSHLLSEIDQMATHTGIIDRGELIYQDSMKNLHEHSRSHLKLKTLQPEQALQFMTQRHIPCSRQASWLTLPGMNDEQTAALTAAMVHEGIGILRIEEQQQNLEDIFLNLTGKKVSL